VAWPQALDLLVCLRSAQHTKYRTSCSKYWGSPGTIARQVSRAPHSEWGSPGTIARQVSWAPHTEVECAGVHALPSTSLLGGTQAPHASRTTRTEWVLEAKGSSLIHVGHDITALATTVQLPTARTNLHISQRTDTPLQQMRWTWPKLAHQCKENQKRNKCTSVKAAETAKEWTSMGEVQNEPLRTTKNSSSSYPPQCPLWLHCGLFISVWEVLTCRCTQIAAWRLVCLANLVGEWLAGLRVGLLLAG
jgi:hypothetical protein